MLPEVYINTVACIYNVDGKCKGMLTLERLHILQKAFEKAKCSGLHSHIKPPPIRFASELIGLIACKDISASIHTNKKIKDSLPDTPLPHHRRLSEVGLGHWRKNGIPPRPWPQIPSLLEWAPEGQSVWGKHQRLLLLILWVLHLPFHLPWKHDALSNKTHHLPSTLLLSAQRKQPHSCSSLLGIKIWPHIPMHHSTANTHTCVSSWAPSHQTNSNMRKCPSGTIYKYHFPNTPGNWRSLPYGTPRAESASTLTTKTG